MQTDNIISEVGGERKEYSGAHSADPVGAVGAKGRYAGQITEFTEEASMAARVAPAD